MPTVIKTIIKDTYYLTSRFPVVSATTDKLCVTVSLSCDNAGNDDTFFSTTLYSFGGTVELADAGSLIEQYFRNTRKVLDTVTFTFDDVSVSAKVLFCEYSTVLDYNPESTLFLAADVQRVHQDSVVAFAAYDRGASVPFVIKAYGHRKSDGAITLVTKSETRSLANANTTYFSVPTLLRWALGLTADDPGVELDDVLYFTIAYGPLQKTCYIVPAPAYLTFSFLNIFNVSEFIDIVGTMTSKTEVTRNTARCGGESRQYDRVVSRSYQVETEPVPSSEIPVFEQFLASPGISLFLGTDDYPVIITDHTSEPSNDDSSLTTFKFTWRFADSRPMVFDSLTHGYIPERRRIFDNTFSSEYA